MTWLWVAFGIVGMFDVVMFVREWRRITAQGKRDIAEMEARHAVAEVEIEQWKADVFAYLDK